MSQVDRVTKNVHKLLTDKFGKVIVNADGRFEFPYESTILHVEVLEFLEVQTLIQFDALIAADSKSNADVLEWCNTANMTLKFGTMTHIASGKQNVTILKHAILGDNLDADELFTSLRMLILVADKLDDEFVSEFGGKRYEDI
jgi:hypothetical protein